jgi:hypothetical protein
VSPETILKQVQHKVQDKFTTLGLCVRRGIWKTLSPELKPIEDTKAENIFYCSSMFGQPDMKLMVVLSMRLYSSPPADAKLPVGGRFNRRPFLVLQV